MAKVKGITAPRAAPAETPNIDGSAKGFLKTPCITAPDIDKAKPTKKDNIILGSLISNKIDLFVESNDVESEKNKWNISTNEISTTPFDIEVIESVKTSIRIIDRYIYN